MNSLKIKNFKNENTEKTLNLIQKLVNLRLKKRTKQNFKSHLVKKNKKKIAQVLTLQRLLKIVGI